MNKIKNILETQKRQLILVVDDHPENLTILEADLLEEGYEVNLAAGGAEALQSIQLSPPDLILLDISMPGMDGIEVCRRIRNSDENQDIPVIMVTGRDAPRDLVKGLDAGANDYITKPIQLEILLARVRTQLRLKDLSDQLKQNIKEIEELQNLRTDFVAMITHDMKAPLTSIVGFSAILKDEVFASLPNQDSRDAVKNISSNAKKLTRLINDFLTFSRIEAGKLEFHFEPVDLHLSTLQVLSLMQFQADQKELVFDYSSIESPPAIRGDSTQIERAISNLISNAIKFSPKGGKIQIRLQKEPEGLKFEVQDQGPGISQDLLPKLFDRYFRVKVSKKVEGTGLGLSIVKSIVEAHGGTVEIETQLNVGTTFCLRFPVWKQRVD